jgi:misacylated tRNA(Ala) deacylase
VSRTHRLELDDQTLREWDAVVLEAGPDGIVLDRSAFYPGGGGQPPDHGVLLAGGVQTRVVDARRADGDYYLVPLDGDPVPPGFKESVEEACNAELRLDRPIAVRSLPRAEAFEIPDIIRTATNLVPEDVKDVRIVDIVGLDQQADGGTHVASTAAVGRIAVVKVENKGKGFRRLRIAISD